MRARHASLLIACLACGACVQLFLLATHISWQTKKQRPLPTKKQPTINQQDSLPSTPLVSHSVPHFRHIVRPAELVEVWGKAAIGDYFWKHIIQKPLAPKLGGLWSRGDHRIRGTATSPPLQLTFRTGYGVQTAKVPFNAKHVVMILNGHNDEKIPTAKAWLEHVRSMPSIKNVGLIILAEESCLNYWLEPYLQDPQIPIKFVFLVYGSHLIDDKRVFQYPLGVATYRGFPTTTSDERSLAPLGTRRRHFCNFAATIYPGSSREKLLSKLQASEFKDECAFMLRYEWAPKEAHPEEYHNTLLNSEYTLCPAGQNTECYRWYEAAQMGSTPIIEAVIHPSTCTYDPVRLLRQAGAPFIYVQNWDEVVPLLQKLHSQTDEEFIQQRKRVVQWYAKFKQDTKKDFETKLSTHFEYA
eukprot:m.127313 g.127313  ORF g.127313 m.127313 type:complete len:413 (-) comp23539_c0_seq1:124-1362(-)